MEKEFVPNEQAIALKELGFDERCFTRYYESGKLADSLSYLHHNYFEQVNAPLYQQAFRWFREKYELHSYIQADYSWNISGGIWDLNGYKGSRYEWDSEAYLSYEEAELACLIKLIEIVKTNDSK